jgi:predicted protein tyrosine phosphatase
MDKEDENEEDLLLAGVDGIELDESDIAELKRMQLDIKEKKFTSKRNSVLCHAPIGRFRRHWRAFNLATGSAWKNNAFDEVLPWMYLGRGELAQNSHFLEKHGFTHVLNLTTSIKNAHPSKFVYKRIPIEDKITEDASVHFRTIIEFIRRVSACKGKIYIHCTVGASRAPMAVMLYFVVVRKISLVDIYAYLQAIRPVVGPNKHFLFQLSEIEVRATSIYVRLSLCLFLPVMSPDSSHHVFDALPLRSALLCSLSLCAVASRYGLFRAASQGLDALRVQRDEGGGHGVAPTGRCVTAQQQIDWLID